MKKTQNGAVLILILLWLMTVLTVYYWGHQSALLPPVNGLLRISFQLGILALIGLAAYGLGRGVLTILSLSSRGAEQLVMATGLGGGGLALLGLGLSAFGLVRATILWAIVLFLAVVTAVIMARRRPSLPALPRGWSRLEKYLLLLLGVNWGVGVVLALAPPTAWDALSTHLVLLEKLLESGRLLAESVFQRPLAGHLLYVWGMGLGGAVLPQLMSYAMATAMGVAVWRMGIRYATRSVALLAVVILFAVEVFVLTMGWPYADGPAGWWATLALYALLRWLEPEHDVQNGWLIAAAILGALAGSAKLNGLFVLPPLVVGTLLGLWWRRDRLGRHLQIAALAGATSGAILGLWHLAERSVQNPGATSVSRLAGEPLAVAREVSAGPLSQMADYVVTAWQMTVIGQQGAAIFDGTITPLFLMLLPVLLLIPGKGRILNAVALFALLEFAAWLVVRGNYYQSRHVIPAYPFFALLTAYVYHRLPHFDRPWFTISGFTKLLLLLVLTVQSFFFLGWYATFDPTAYLLGLQSRDAYLAERLNGGTAVGYYDAVIAINHQVSPEQLVAIAYPEPRTFYCEPTCDRVRLPFRGTVEEMSERLAGYDYLLVSWDGIEYWQEFTADQPATMAEWIDYQESLRGIVEARAEPVADTGGYVLYRLTR